MRKTMVVKQYIRIFVEVALIGIGPLRRIIRVEIVLFGAHLFVLDIDDILFLLQGAHYSRNSQEKSKYQNV